MKFKLFLEGHIDPDIAAQFNLLHNQLKIPLEYRIYFPCQFSDLSKLTTLPVPEQMNRLMSQHRMSSGRIGSINPLTPEIGMKKGVDYGFDKPRLQGNLDYYYDKAGFLHIQGRDESSRPGDMVILPYDKAQRIEKHLAQHLGLDKAGILERRKQLPKEEVKKQFTFYFNVDNPDKLARIISHHGYWLGKTKNGTIVVRSEGDNTLTSFSGMKQLTFHFEVDSGVIISLWAKYGYRVTRKTKEGIFVIEKQ